MADENSTTSVDAATGADANTTTQQPADAGNQSRQAGQPDGGQTLMNAKPEGGADGGQPAAADWRFDAEDFKDQGLNPGFIDGYSEIAKELGLSKDSASALLTKAAELVEKMDVEGVERQASEWIAAARNDKEFGGSALNANLAIAKKGLETFGGQPLKDLLESTGLGNHPEVIRFFYRVGKTVSEDSFDRGGASSGPASEEERMRKIYPKMFEQKEHGQL